MHHQSILCICYLHRLFNSIQYILSSSSFTKSSTLQMSHKINYTKFFQPRKVGRGGQGKEGRQTTRHIETYQIPQCIHFHVIHCISLALFGLWFHYSKQQSKLYGVLCCILQRHTNQTHNKIKNTKKKNIREAHIVCRMAMNWVCVTFFSPPCSFMIERIS